MTISTRRVLLALSMLLPALATAADPWADTVVTYESGTGFAAGFDDPAAALGEPTRFTAPTSAFGGPTTPFNSSFGAGETVSIGFGGSLTVRFDEPVVDDPLNPFGIDLLVFGNSFLGLDFAAGTATGAVFGEGGVIAISDNGVDFVEVSGVEADGLFPTVGYQDLTEAFPSSAGSVPTDFTLPVDPSLSAADLAGLDTAGILEAYDGSGGGAGVDIGAVGFTEISYVRVTNTATSGSTPEIDGFADVRAVPEPGAVGLVVLAAIGAARFCRTGGRV